MIDAVHAVFLRWAQWVLEPVDGEGPGGYGKNILQRIVEGKGMLLPGSAGGRKQIRRSPDAEKVEAYLKTLSHREVGIIKVFYLTPLKTVEERAKRLRMPVRTLYDRIDRIHKHFEGEQRSQQL